MGEDKAKLKGEVMTRGVRMPRDYRDPAASPCVSATRTAGGPVQGNVGFTPTGTEKRRPRPASKDQPRTFPLHVFYAPCTCVSPLRAVTPRCRGHRGFPLHLGTHDLSRHHAECVTLHQA